MEFLFVGLGNPGAEYENTRHNVGFYFIDALVSRWGGAVDPKEKWQGLYVSFSYKGHKIHCVKPQTYMNRSGESVAVYSNFFKISLQNTVVIHDDLDMAPARIKFVLGGGSGGHNGIKSLVNSLGDAGFYRLKIGIGRPGQNGVHPRFPVDKYVLGSFSPEEVELLDGRKDAVSLGFDRFFDGDIARAVGVFNSLKGGG